VIKFKNEIDNQEWVIGSGIVMLMIWFHLLFPRALSRADPGQLEVGKIPADLWPLVAIYPRQIESLPGIILAHFTHLDMGHLAANLPQVIIFLIILAKISMRFWQIILGIMLTSGTMIWAFHPSTNEYTNLLGASALIFGLFGYILLRIVVNKDFILTIAHQSFFQSHRPFLLNAWVSIVSFSVIIVYWKSSLSFGLNFKDAGDGISIYGHLFGFLSGVLVYFVEFFYVTYKYSGNTPDK